MSRWPGANRSARFATAILGVYFEGSYRLLSSRSGRQLLLQASSVPGVEAHGYVTRGDLIALEGVLEPSPSQKLIDVGCGFGDIARWLHARSNAEIVGFDVSRRALAEARRRARRDGAESAVHFDLAALDRPPAVDAAGAYAIDSLMFAADLPDAVRGIAASLGGQGRLFATLLLFGSDPSDNLARTEAITGSTRLLLTDVTPALAEVSRRRRIVARSLLRAGGRSLSGKAAMLLVIAEESLVGALLAHGKVRRVRWAIEFGPTPPASTD